MKSVPFSVTDARDQRSAPNVHSTDIGTFSFEKRGQVKSARRDSHVTCLSSETFQRKISTVKGALDWRTFVAVSDHSLSSLLQTCVRLSCQFWGARGASYWYTYTSPYHAVCCYLHAICHRHPRSKYLTLYYLIDLRFNISLDTK